MWLGEQITQRGIGNGISLIIFSGIVAEIPRALVTTFELGRTGAVSTIMILAMMEVNNGNLTLGSFVGLNAIIIQLSVPLNFLGTVYREIRQALVDLEAMFEIFSQKIEIKDKNDEHIHNNNSQKKNERNTKRWATESRMHVRVTGGVLLRMSSEKACSATCSP